MNKKLSCFLAGLTGLALYTHALVAATPGAGNTTAGNTTAGPAPGVTADVPAAEDLAKLPKVSDKKDVSFDKDIAPLLKASCMVCHSGDTPKSGFDVSTATSMIKDKKGRVQVVPGHSDQSPLVWNASDIVEDEHMPPDSARTRDTNPVKALTPDEIGLIRAWIDQGAKQN
jgi:hypothetical protein